MPRYRLILWATASTVAMVLLTVSIAAAQDPSPAAGSSAAQDPFQVAEKSAESADKAGAKKTEKKAEPEPEFVNKTLQEWMRILPRAVFEVTRLKRTEGAFTGRYATGHFRGTFVCACCNGELFSSQTKFESGTGWPSFWQPVSARAIDRAIDNSEGEPRMEVMCHRCGAHLGHVFDDGPPPTGLRFCINSLSLKLKQPDGTVDKAASGKSKAKSKIKTANTRSRNTMLSSRNKSTAKTPNPGSQGQGDEKPGGSETPSTGKTGGI
jgi:peptide-methionine (R)-S-oxide reductase